MLPYCGSAYYVDFDRFLTLEHVPVMILSEIYLAEQGYLEHVEKCRLYFGSLFCTLVHIVVVQPI